MVSPVISRVATIVRDVRVDVSVPAQFERYALLDRGSYEHARVDAPAAIASLASEVTGRELEVISARVVRLSPGDYVLAHHDHEHDEHLVEVMLDLSQVAVPGAEVRYQRGGNVFFVFPSTPGAASVVERGPGTRCHHTYVSRRQAAQVVRVVVLLKA
jgi:hypothetical protein